METAILVVITIVFVGLVLLLIAGTQTITPEPPNLTPEPPNPKKTPSANKAPPQLHDPLDNTPLGFITEDIVFSFKQGKGTTNIKMRIRKENAKKLRKRGLSAFPNFKGNLRKKQRYYVESAGITLDDIEEIAYLFEDILYYYEDCFEPAFTLDGDYYPEGFSKEINRETATETQTFVEEGLCPLPEIITPEEPL